ncbi:MAG: exodeoxyribonuclease VII large subunit, partial [Candidatus Omnitrophota bacterium]|nr:exodeoxyribonuclease VII large subunit [Candidatus Omnitrophota bacterium]
MKDSPRHIYTVSEITQDIKLILESTFEHIWVEGEVSNFVAQSSGHHYFSLKDQSAVLPAVMFSWANKEVKFKFENGLKVICFGKISIYSPHGKYQIIIEKVEPKGIGSLQLALEQLKQRLEKEGLFAPGHKRKIPYLPQRLGVVTSSSGAAIKDILKVLDRRFGDVHIIVRAAQVQGESAKEDIASAIKDLNDFNAHLGREERIEVMIVGRGGGSIEDLWAFNEEIVARAIYNSTIPVVSAVGHERDWTIADLVADLRAATPSVAAEIVIPKKEDLKEKLNYFITGLKGSILDFAVELQDDLDNLARRLSLMNPMLLIQQHKLKILDLARQILVRTQHFFSLRETEFKGSVEKLSALSPLNILGRGYSITFKLPENLILK